jgi:hypothetical protein
MVEISPLAVGLPANALPYHDAFPGCTLTVPFDPLVSYQARVWQCWVVE